MTMRHAAGGAGDVDEPDPTEEQLDPEGRAVRNDDDPEGGAPAAIKGTSLAGPTGGTVGAMADGSLGSTVDPDPESRPIGDEPTERR